MHWFSISLVVLLMMAGIDVSAQQENSAEITSQLTKFSISFLQVGHMFFFNDFFRILY